MVLIETTCESNWEQFELFPFFYTCKIVHYIILYNCIIIDSNFCCFNVEEWSLLKIVFIISEPMLPILCLSTCRNYVHRVLSPYQEGN